MRELQQKQKIKKRLYSAPALAGLAVITLLLLHGVYGVLKKQHESAGYVKTLEAKVSTLSDRQTELKEGIARLKSDDGIDAEIKDKFSVSKAGEHVVVIVDPRPTATSTATTTRAWYKRLWGSIMGH